MTSDDSDEYAVSMREMYIYLVLQKNFSYTPVPWQLAADIIVI